MKMRTATLIGTAILAIALVTACSESREEKFEKALRAAESAQKTVDSARKEVESELARYEKASAAAEAAEKKLAKARSQLESAESKAARARAEVAKWADDATVFRSVQRRLLEERSLGNAAISARVQGGVAYLEGNVARSTERERAIQIARETPGVVDVQSSITVGSASATTPSIAPAPAAEPEAATQATAPEPAPIPVDVLPVEPMPAEPAPQLEAPAPAQPAAESPSPATGDTDVYWPDKNLPR
jgi:osmotically-inducible protein OsmY